MVFIFVLFIDGLALGGTLEKRLTAIKASELGELPTVITSLPRVLAKQRI